MTTLTLPGLIDPHVHLREPGHTHKEDFDSGTAAALAGGFTTVLAMPNTEPPISDAETFRLAMEAARAKARCDVGLYVGATADNAAEAATLAGQAAGLKMYCDSTFGPLRLQGIRPLEEHVGAWPAGRPLAAHAEGRSLAAVILLSVLFDRPVHICHISRREEILLVRRAKERGWKVTCEVTPHHLFLTEADARAMPMGRGEVRPPLASERDRQSLWENLNVIDCFASDHAPHTLPEKDGPSPPPGFPGLETTLGLLLTAVAESRLTFEEVIVKLFSNPRRIFDLPEQADTRVEVDPQAVWQVVTADLQSRCGWTPFEGMKLRGRVRRVYLRGRMAFVDGEVLARPGWGWVLGEVRRAEARLAR
jgi:carbamoyl-phosphate synthase/aspartate carbamoyltransferase/dihydroorotase